MNILDKCEYKFEFLKKVLYWNRVYTKHNVKTFDKIKTQIVEDSVHWFS